MSVSRAEQLAIKMRRLERQEQQREKEMAREDQGRARGGHDVDAVVGTPGQLEEGRDRQGGD